MRWLLLALLALPVAVASAPAQGTFEAREDACAAEARVLYDCWLAVRAVATATCASADACEFRIAGNATTSDEAGLRQVETRMLLRSSPYESWTSTTCTSLAVGRSTCPVLGRVTHPLAPGGCVPVEVSSVLRDALRERARVEASRTACRALDGAVTWS